MDLGDPTGWTDRERAFFAAGWNDCVEKQPGQIKRLRATLLNIQSYAESGFQVSNARLASQCKHALDDAHQQEKA